jgi:flagellar motility protein MotE (MotC chaperone)
MAGRIFAPFLPKLVMVLPAALLAAVIARPAASPNGQSQDQQSSYAQKQSIADAARKSREAAKNATKPSKVITDDDLDKENIKPGAQGLTLDGPAQLETQPPTAGAVAEAEVTPSTPPDPATAAAASDDPEIRRLKESIADAEKDADLSRRDMALQQDTYFSNPDYVHDTAGKAKLAALQQQINDKQQDIDRLKTRLAALEELQNKKRATKSATSPAPGPAAQTPNPNDVPPAPPKP